MKKIHLSYILLLSILVAFAACNQDNEDRIYNPTSEDVTFMIPAQKFLITPLVTEIEFDLLRGNSKDELEVALQYSEDLEFFSAPASVKFADGESKVTIKVGLKDVDKMEFNKDYVLKASMPESMATEWGVKETALSVVVDYNWEEVGEGSYESLIFGGRFKALFLQAVENSSAFKFYDVFKNTISFEIDKQAGTAVMPAQDLGEDVFGAGSNSWIRGLSGTYSNGVVTFGPAGANNAVFTDNTFSSGATFTSEKIHLPAGTY